MKAILVIACLSVVCSFAPASEIVTLGPSKQSVTVAPTDTVEVLSVLVGNSTDYLDFGGTGATGSPPYLAITGQATGSVMKLDLVLTGVSSVSLRAGDQKHLVTLRITKPGEGFVSESLVVPLAHGTTYAVALETSTDMQIWVPANPGDYVSSSTARFFRVKAAVSPSAP